MKPISTDLDVVYYGSPVPRNGVSFALLGLLFDRIHFPGVHLPEGGFDLAEVLKEAKRIEDHGMVDYERALLLGSMRMLKHIDYLKQFCTFAPRPELPFQDPDEKQTNEIVKALDVAIWGEPPENFIPSYPGAHWKTLPGSEEAIEYPGTLHYPARALIYSAKEGIPMVNDNPELPIPGLGGGSPKNNAKLLATILAIECANLILPIVRPLTPQEIVEARDELAPYRAAFRRGMLELTTHLNAQIQANSTDEDIRETSRFLIEAKVIPALAELQNVMASPKRNWLAASWEVAKEAPAIVTAFSTLPKELAVAKLMAAAGSAFLALDKQDESSKTLKSQMYFLLKLRTIAATRR